MYPDWATNMDWNSKMKVPPQVMWRAIGEETVLLNLERGLYFGLDEVGARIWELLAAEKSFPEIASVVAGEYDVNIEQVRSDLIEFIGTLVEKGLLEKT